MSKQETLEEAAERLMPKTIVSEQGKAIWRLAFEESVKWQEKRSSTEAIEFAKWLEKNAQQREYWPMVAMSMEELFEEFKNPTTHENL